MPVNTSIYVEFFSTSVGNIFIPIYVLQVAIEMYTKTYTDLHMKGISGFRREVENFVYLNYYAASSGNSLPKFRDNLSVPPSRVKNPFLTLDDGIDTMSRDVGKELPLLAA
jgi:hypothetical protein